MTTTVHATTIPTPLVPAEWYGDYAADYDTDAIESEVRAALNRMLPGPIYVAANGQVYADAATLDEALSIDYRALLEQIDLEIIAHDNARFGASWRR